MCEPTSREPEIVGRGFLSLRLRPGTTVREAQEIARYLQDRVTGIGYTRP